MMHLFPLLGCGPGEADRAPDASSEPVAEGLMLVEVASLPTKWVAADGWVINAARVVPDITGDGISDAVVSINEDGLGGDWSSVVVVAGPLRRSLVLPGDEAASLGRGGVLTVGDATGDGITDLLLVEWYDWGRIFPGPVTESVDAFGSGTEVVGEVSDVDGDGILDKTYGLAGQLEVTWGPLSRWSGPPDLVIEAPCDRSGDYGSYSVTGVASHADVTGDGRREVWFRDNDHTCSSWLFPQPVGVADYDPGQDGAAASDAPAIEVVGDQTGDSIPDVWVAADTTLYSGPITLESDGSVRTSATILADPDLEAVHPVPFDHDGDGLTDFVALDSEIDDSEVLYGVGGLPPDRELDEMLVLVPGGTALSSPMYTTAWDVEGRAFGATSILLEDGIASVLVTNPVEVVVVDLGPASIPY